MDCMCMRCQVLPDRVSTIRDVKSKIVAKTKIVKDGEMRCSMKLFQIADRRSPWPTATQTTLYQPLIDYYSAENAKHVHTRELLCIVRIYIWMTRIVCTAGMVYVAHSTVMYGT